MKQAKKLLSFLTLVLVVVLLFSSVPASAGGNPYRVKILAEARNMLEQELEPALLASAIRKLRAKSSSLSRMNRRKKECLALIMAIRYGRKLPGKYKHFLLR